MTIKTFTVRSNAARAAKATIAAGKAPAATFEIVKSAADGLFTIEWQTAEQVTANGAEADAIMAAMTRKKPAKQAAPKAAKKVEAPKATAPTAAEAATIAANKARKDAERLGAIKDAEGMLAGDRDGRRAGLEKLVKLGVTDDEIDAMLNRADEAQAARPKASSRAKSGTPRARSTGPVKARAGGAREKMIAMLRAKSGATAAELMEATGLSIVSGRLSEINKAEGGALRKEKAAGGTRYFLPATA